MAAVNRRLFCGSALATGIAALASTSQAANETKDIRVAVIGLRGRGRSHMKALEANITALCDVDERILQNRSDEFKQSTGRSVKKYVDYRRLLNEADVEAVSIATPNHTHTLIAIEAMQAGKDVYVEKPVSHNVWEGRQLVAAAEQYGKIVQCGTQGRSSSGIREAVEWVQAGGLGKILYALGTCYKPRLSIGKLSSPRSIPKQVHYELWCGPAEKRDLYRPELHYDWHWDFNTGNGDMGNQGIHQVDMARWFLGETQLPRRVLSIGGRLGYEDAGNTPNTQVAYLDYPRAPLLFETRGLPRSKSAQSDWEHSMDAFRGIQIGVLVQCEQGHVLVPGYSGAVVFDRQGKKIREWVGASDHFANWLQAVAHRDSALLNAPIREGEVSSALCHVAAISHRLGTQAVDRDIAEQIAGNDLLSNSFDRMAGHLRANEVDLSSEPGGLCLGRWLELEPAGREVIGDVEASALLRRQDRKPFVVPELV